MEYDFDFVAFCLAKMILEENNTIIKPHMILTPNKDSEVVFLKQLHLYLNKLPCNNKKF